MQITVRRAVKTTAFALLLLLPLWANAYISLSFGFFGPPAYYPPVYPAPVYYYAPPPVPAYPYYPPPTAYYYPYYNQVWVGPCWRNHRYYPGHYERHYYRHHR